MILRGTKTDKNKDLKGKNVPKRFFEAQMFRARPFIRLSRNNKSCWKATEQTFSGVLFITLLIVSLWMKP